MVALLIRIRALKTTHLGTVTGPGMWKAFSRKKSDARPIVRSVKHKGGSKSGSNGPSGQSGAETCFDIVLLK
ncbi:hypothetical protein HPB51_027938 [Rhipicephalus microplus]|uniref:Uncharacterized protein n=1 Tax=Rhipicephalus microplus TaxID=6941 RepID=A0A9J6CYW1_RHIMP|nr:hypothetical protein HPB51_027938 [Rhipicephalus microplus]